VPREARRALVRTIEDVRPAGWRLRPPSLAQACSTPPLTGVLSRMRGCAPASQGPADAHFRGSSPRRARVGCATFPNPSGMRGGGLLRRPERGCRGGRRRRGHRSRGSHDGRGRRCGRWTVAAASCHGDRQGGCDDDGGSDGTNGHDALDSGRWVGIKLRRRRLPGFGRGLTQEMPLVALSPIRPQDRTGGERSLVVPVCRLPEASPHARSRRARA
jgi:hypothetical protein